MKITIHVDEDGDAEIRSPSAMSDAEVLEILEMAVAATEEKIAERKQARDSTSATLQLHTKKYKQ